MANEKPTVRPAGADRVRELEAENAELRAKLSEAGQPVAQKPHAPSFRISEGTREELERNGEATDPFTGKKLTRADLPK